MTTDNGITSVESMKSPIGKVIGVVETRAQFQAVSEALAKLGVQEVEVLEGANGINHLEDDQAAVAQCILGDMEAKWSNATSMRSKRGRSFSRPLLNQKSQTRPPRLPRREEPRKLFTLEFS